MLDDDPDDIEGLAQEYFAEFDPADRKPESTAIGGRTVSWRDLPAENARHEWTALREWVEWFTIRYDLPPATIPNCWWRHGPLVEELSALHSAHRVAFDSADTGYGPITWHERLASAMPRLKAAYAGGCNAGHRSRHSGRSWQTVTDENEWDAWTSQAHGHNGTA